MELKYIELTPRIIREKEMVKRASKPSKKGNEFFQKVKVAVGITAFTLAIGLAGTSDLESQTTYIVKATAVNDYELVSERGVEVYSEEPLIQGKQYAITLDIESDEIVRIKQAK